MSVELIKNLVESEFELKLKRRTRKREYVEARAMYYMLLRNKSKMTVSAIAKTMDRNHATILHALKGLQNWMSYDTNIKSVYDSLEKKVDNIIRLHPDLFGIAITEEEFYILAYNELQNSSKLKYDELASRYRALRGRYSFLLFKLRHTSPKTYETFKHLETNDI